MAVDEETLRENLDNPEVRAAWRIPQANSYARIAAVVHILALVAMTVALAAYFITGSHEMVYNRFSGLLHAAPVFVQQRHSRVGCTRINQNEKSHYDLPASHCSIARTNS